MPDDCLFCGIVAGRVPATTVAETELAVAFRDLDPQAPTHVLVVPRRHIDNAATVTDADGDVVAGLLTTAREVARAEGLLEGGYRLVLNVGDDAGNTVPHLHLHVLGGRPMSWPPG